MESKQQRSLNETVQRVVLGEATTGEKWHIEAHKKALAAMSHIDKEFGKQGPWIDSWDSNVSKKYNKENDTSKMQTPQFMSKRGRGDWSFDISRKDFAVNYIYKGGTHPKGTGTVRYDVFLRLVTDLKSEG